MNEKVLTLIFLLKFCLIGSSFAMIQDDTKTPFYLKKLQTISVERSKQIKSYQLSSTLRLFSYKKENNKSQYFVHQHSLFKLSAAEKLSNFEYAIELNPNKGNSVYSVFSGVNYFLKKNNKSSCKVKTGLLNEDPMISISIQNNSWEIEYLASMSSVDSVLVDRHYVVHNNHQLVFSKIL